MRVQSFGCDNGTLEQWAKERELSAMGAWKRPCDAFLRCKAHWTLSTIIPWLSRLHPVLVAGLSTAIFEGNATMFRVSPVITMNSEAPERSTHCC